MPKPPHSLGFTPRNHVTLRGQLDDIYLVDRTDKSLGFKGFLLIADSDSPEKFDSRIELALPYTLGFAFAFPKSWICVTGELVGVNRHSIEVKTIHQDEAP